MECVPDAVLVEVLSFLPQKAFLPICHVSKRFRDTWIDMKLVPADVFGHVDDRQPRIVVCEVPSNNSRNDRIPCVSSNLINGAMEKTNHLFLSSPLQDGNLFDPIHDKWQEHQPLRTSLLEYYISCGWSSPSRLQLVLRAAAARGDIDGMKYILKRGQCSLEDKDICTAAGRAGQLDSLLWLREKGCPWNATEVFQEASENFHQSIMTYVYLNSDENDLRLSTVGMPW